jgi:hypothetical protein
LKNKFSENEIENDISKINKSEIEGKKYHMKLTQTKIKLDNNFTNAEFKIDEGK